MVWSHLEGNVHLYPEEEVDRAIVDAIGQINLATGFFRSAYQFRLLPGHTVYDAPYGIVQVFAVRVNGEDLSRATLASLALHRDDPQGSWPRYWATIGCRQLLVFPAPPVEVDAMAFGVASSRLIYEDPDVVIAEPLLSEISALAAHLLLLKEGGRPFHDSLPAYQRLISELRSRLTVKIPRFRIPPVTEEPRRDSGE